MANFVAYDYAIPISSKAIAEPQSLDYLRKAYVVCISNAVSPLGVTVIEDITDPTDIAGYTDDKGIDSLFDAGMTSINMITLDPAGSIVDAKTEIEALLNKTLTILIHSSVGGTPQETLDTCSISKNIVIAKIYPSASLADAEILVSKGCAFIDDSTDLKSMYFYFGLLLSYPTFINHQYAALTPATGSLTVADVGTAENYFNKRLSFAIDGDGTSPRELGFFVCGGATMTDRYIDEEVARKIQEKGKEFIAVGAPFKTDENLKDMTLTLRTVFVPYESSGQLLAGQSTLNITDNGVDFMAAGTIAMKKAQALWRTAFELI